MTDDKSSHPREDDRNEELDESPVPEPEEGGQDVPVTTVTFEERDGATLVTVCDRYPSKEALDDAIASGSTGGWSEQLRQLDVILSDPDGLIEGA